MEENETFDEFYAKLKDIVNSAFNLEESIAEPKIVRKILRSLSERFHAKITVIEEVKDIDKIPLTKLVGNLQTYEMRLHKIGKGGKSRSMALKGIVEERDDSENKDENEDDETFDEFCAKLKDIVNSTFNLGESIAEPKIVRKILRFVPEKFHAKITVIEEVKDIVIDHKLNDPL